MRGKVLYPASMLALAIGLSTSAHAQTITPGATVATPNGGTTCADGTETGYIVADSPNPGQTSAVTCFNQDVTQSYSVSNPFTPEFIAGGAPGNLDAGFSSESGSASSGYNGVIESTIVTEQDPNPPFGTIVVSGPTDGPLQPTSPEVVANYTYDGTTRTFDQNMTYDTLHVDGAGTTGTGTQTSNAVTTTGISFSETTGTSTFTPGTGEVSYTATAGSSTEIDETGITLSSFDETGTASTTVNSSGVTTTGSVDAPVVNTALINGTGPDGALVLHGGTSSTDVTISDAGFLVDLDGDTVPDFGARLDGLGGIEGGIAGNWSVGGDLEVDGQTITNGLTNNGVITTNVLNVTTAIANSAVLGVPDAAPVVVADSLFVTGQVRANGINNNGQKITNIADGTAATDAASVGQMNAGDAATLASANAYTDTSVAAEAAARVAADAILQANINTEAATRAAADTTLQNNINAEAATRLAVDTTLQNNINAEATTRAAADTAETNARIAADTAEANARIAGDAATLASAKSYTDAKVGALSLELRDRIASSTATAIALGGTAILPDSNFTLAGNVGFYQGAQALAVNAAARIAPNVYATGAFGGGLNKHGEIGGRVGFVFGF